MATGSETALLLGIIKLKTLSYLGLGVIGSIGKQLVVPDRNVSWKLGLFTDLVVGMPAAMVVGKASEELGAGDASYALAFFIAYTATYLLKKVISEIEEASIKDMLKWLVMTKRK